MDSYDAERESSNDGLHLGRKGSAFRKEESARQRHVKSQGYLSHHRPYLCVEAVDESLDWIRSYAARYCTENLIIGTRVCTRVHWAAAGNAR